MHAAAFVPKQHPLSRGLTHPIYVLVLLEPVSSAAVIHGALTYVEIIDRTLVHDHGTCLHLFRSSAHSWKVWSAHPVLLAVFAGMQPLEAFCTFSLLMAFSNRIDGDKAAFLDGLPNDSCFLFTGIFFSGTKSSESQQQKSVIPNKRESSQHTSGHHPSWSTCSWMHWMQFERLLMSCCLANAIWFRIGMQLWRHFGIKASYVPFTCMITQILYSYRYINITYQLSWLL